MEKIRVVIADDEPLACENLELLLERYEDLEVVSSCDCGADAIDAIESLCPDLLFLDIELGDMSGFDVLRKSGCETPPVVIFVTAFDEYAVRAFEVSALDYLLKPFDDGRFDQAVMRAIDRVRENRLNDYSDRLMELLQTLEEGRGGVPQKMPPRGAIGRIAVRSRGRIEFVQCTDIDWISAAGSYVEIHTSGKMHLLRETMNNLEESLNPTRFVRIHRSTIVNIERVKELKPHKRGEYFVTLDDGTQLKLSRGNRDKLDRLLAPAR